MTKKKKFALFIGLLVVALIGFRLYLPTIVKDYVNARINALDGYSGSIVDIDLFLWRGAYQIDGLRIYKDKMGTETPFAAADTVDLSIEWTALFKGAVVAEIDIYNAELNFTKYQTGEGAGWKKLADKLSPFDINRFDIHSGRVEYADYTAEPNVHLFIDGIDANITNIRQIINKDEKLPSNITLSGTSIGGGALSINGSMDALRDLPDMDLAMELENADLTAINDYARDAVAIDFESGNLNLYSELAIADARLVSYLKILATDVSLVDLKQDSNPINALYESLASVFIEIFENQEEDQFALRIPIEGNLGDPDSDNWSAFLSVFENAFGNAFTRDEDGTINFRDAIKDYGDE